MHRRALHRTLTIGLPAALLLAAALGAGVAQAAGNTLDNPQVTPRSGTFQTTFTFSVHYLAGNQGIAPSSVVATAGTTVVSLSLSSGAPTDGTYSGSSQLLPGIHTVTFSATVAQQGNPTEPAGQVTVSPPPTPIPTPSPTPPPTPPPTPIPTPIPTPTASASVAGGGSATPSASAVESGSAGPSDSASPLTSSSAASTPTPTPEPIGSDGGMNAGTLTLVIAGAGLVTVGLLAMLLGAVRRGGTPPLAPAPLPAAPVPAARPPAFWEAANRLDDEPIGTVDPDPEEAPAALTPPEEAEPQRRDPDWTDDEADPGR